MAMSTTTGAPILTPAQVNALVIQPLIDQSVAAQVSTVVTTSSHDLRVPRVTADPAAAWTAEGAEIGVSDHRRILAYDEQAVLVRDCPHDVSCDSGTRVERHAGDAARYWRGGIRLQ